MANLESWKKISDTGTKMREIWRNTFESAGLDIGISGIPALSALTIQNENGNAIKTLITQEMLKRKYPCLKYFLPEYRSQG
jgi:glutamate-1-semialdehyde 2,1-aminomutase